MPDTKARAIEAIEKLEAAAIKRPAGTMPDWVARAAMALRTDDADPQQLVDEIQTVRTMLCRGEWDRVFVEEAQLPYLDIFRIPIALLEHCESLELDPGAREGVAIQLGKERDALQSHEMREQVGGGNRVGR